MAGNKTEESYFLRELYTLADGQATRVVRGEELARRLGDGGWGVVSLPPRLSAVVLYLFYFSLFAVIAMTLLEVISALSPGGVP